MFLLLANYPDYQSQIRHEIESVIGDRWPEQNDKSKCHFINAFINEVLRYSSIVFNGVAHKVLVDTQISMKNF